MTIEELRIGMWVSERLPYPKDAPRYSMPMQVEGIFKDGTVYLNFEGNESDLNIPTLHMDIIIWLPGRNNKNILVINQRLALK